MNEIGEIPVVPFKGGDRCAGEATPDLIGDGLVPICEGAGAAPPSQGGVPAPSHAAAGVLSDKILSELGQRAWSAFTQVAGAEPWEAWGSIHPTTRAAWCSAARAVFETRSTADEDAISVASLRARVDQLEDRISAIGTLGVNIRRLLGAVGL